MRRLLALFACTGVLFAGCTSGDRAAGPAEPVRRFTEATVSPAATETAQPGGSPPAGVAVGPVTTPSAATPADATARLQPRPWAAPPVSLGMPPPEFAAAAAIVLDEASGAVLYEREASLHLPPASLTKVATAVLVIEEGGLEREVEVQPDLERYWAEDSATMGLEPGDRFTVMDLLYGLLLASGNDAADALAEVTAGGNAAFVERMNALAGRLGLRDTHFIDAHGLGGAGHYSSAYDLAVLARYAMTFDAFRQVVGTESLSVVGSREIPLYNQNPLLNYTEGVDGVKTGFTEEAGRTFVVSATRGGHRVYLVMLNAPNRALDAITVIEWVFANHRWEG